MDTAIIWNQFNRELLGFIQSRINNKTESEDILQEVFIKIHRNISKVKSEEKLTSWIYQITRNTIIDFYRKKRLPNKDVEEMQILEKEPTVEDNTQLNSCLLPFIEKMEESDRDILTKISLEGVSQKEYAAENNLGYSSVKSRFQRAKKKLKKSFVNCCQIESDKYGNIISTEEKNCDC